MVLKRSLEKPYDVLLFFMAAVWNQEVWRKRLQSLLHCRRVSLEPGGSRPVPNA